MHCIPHGFTFAGLDNMRRVGMAAAFYLFMVMGQRILLHSSL